YFKSNVEPLTFHADYEFKQKIVQMAASAGLGQEEFLLQAVKSYIRNLEQQ
ncbi:excisionase, partial [Bacillus toyonensis]